MIERRLIVADGQQDAAELERLRLRLLSLPYEGVAELTLEAARTGAELLIAADPDAGFLVHLIGADGKGLALIDPSRGSAEVVARIGDQAAAYEARMLVNPETAIRAALQFAQSGGAAPELSWV
ncbi:MAG: hypothetical protein ACAI43_13630 [Phycisphaerae bacterium]|nr:hypothetical protein [Tepidisphaeraceae bacterium]